MIANRWSANQETCAKALFGRPLRVQLAAWILERDKEPFYLSEAQTAMAIAFGSAGSAARDEIRAFAQWGMLSSNRAGARIYYTPEPHDLWDAFGRIAEAIDALDDA